MDWTALADELCEGPKMAATPRDSWSHANKHKTTTTKKLNRSISLIGGGAGDDPSRQPFMLMFTRSFALEWLLEAGAKSEYPKRTRAKLTNAPSLPRLTFPGRLKAVEDVYSLDVVGQRGVGEQGAVPVDCVQGKFEG